MKNTGQQALCLHNLQPGAHIRQPAGNVGVGVQVLGGESPHASSYAGYLLLVMVTLLAHGRRGVMMEDGAR